MLEDALIENSRRSAYERAFANYYANAGGRKDGGEHTFSQYLSYIKSAEGAETTPTPAWYDTEAEHMTTIPTMEKGATAFLITGDASRNKVQTMPGGGFSTVSIDLPADWDALTAAKGYPPLSEMYLPATHDSVSTSAGRPGENQSSAYAVRTNYYRINGQRIARPHSGLNIRQDIRSDGSSDTQKRIYRQLTQP